MAASPPDLPARLAAVEQPAAHLLELHDRSPLSRLYATPAAHRLLPARVAVALAALRGTAEWRLSTGRRAAALAWAAEVAPGAAPARRAALARAHVREAA